MKQVNSRLLFVAIAGLSVFATPAAALVCGDSEPDAGEQCDDGNTTGGDGCSATCLIEAGSDCTSAIASILDPLTPPVPSSCLVGVCGDGVQSDGEGCDDGNLSPGDGCDAVCQVEAGSACAGGSSALDVLLGAVTRPATCGPIGDIDLDGVPDTADNCTAVSNALQRDTDGDGIGNGCDADLDNDCVVTACSGGFSDDSCYLPPVESDMEIFRLVFFTNDPGADFTGDGVVNVSDLQILNSSIGLPPGPSGIPNVCAPGASDDDGDGVPNDDDLCPETLAGDPVDASGCSDPQVDGDGDGYCDIDAPSAGPSVCLPTDNCPTVFNPDQIDVNMDGFGDACVDPSVTVPNNADVDPTATVGADTEINKNVEVGADTSVGNNVVLNSGVSVGDGVDVGDGATLNKDAAIGNGATIGSNVTLGQGVFIGAGAFIGANSVIGKDTVICATAQVGDNSNIGKNNFLQTGTGTLLEPTFLGGVNGPAPDSGACAPAE